MKSCKSCFFLLSLLLMFSCDFSEKKNENVWNMSDSPSTLALNEKIDSISFVGLDDSNTEALFKGVDKMLYVNERFYILDYMGTSSVLVFDNKGTFLFKVGNVGQGPGEYSRVTDFDVNNGRIYLLDSRKRMIFSYDLNGRFIKYYSYLNKIVGVNDLIVTDEGNFLLGMDVEVNPEEQVLLVDTNFVIKKDVLHFDEDVTRNHLNIGSFRRCGNDIVYYHPVSDLFYMFDSNGNLVNSCSLLLDDDLPLSIKIDYAKIADKRETMNLSYFYKTPFVCGDFLVTEGVYKSKNVVICADLSKRTCFWDEYRMVDSLSFRDFKFPKYLDEDRVICLFSGSLYEYLDEKSKMMLDERCKNILARDGFMLIVYHLKD